MRRSLLKACRAACNQQTGITFSVQPAVSQISSRPYSQPTQDDQDSEPVPEKVQQLAKDIMGLTVLECSQLSNILRDKLGVPRGAAMPMMGMPMMGMPAAGPAAGAAGEAAEPKEEKKEKTEFDVKLESFTPEGKIKVIKEIRAITALGLKEAKELVEKAPVVIKTGVSKADAEAMQKQLEAVGGKVAME